MTLPACLLLLLRCAVQADISFCSSLRHMELPEVRSNKTSFSITNWRGAGIALLTYHHPYPEVLSFAALLASRVLLKMHIVYAG